MSKPAPDPVTLADLITAHARGLHHHSAAADLLISHRSWLTRPDFTRGFIHPITDDSGQAAAARIDYTTAINALHAGHLPCSTSEAAILAIAASLAEDIPIILSHVLGNLDHRNITLVTHAIHAANGTSTDHRQGPYPC